MHKKVELIRTSNSETYIISNEDLIEGVPYVYESNGTWQYGGHWNDILNTLSTSGRRRIIALPEQIGYASYVLGKGEELINKDQINSILSKGGTCSIKVIEQNNEIVPYLLNNKVVIYL